MNCQKNFVIDIVNRKNLKKKKICLVLQHDTTNPPSDINKLPVPQYFTLLKSLNTFICDNNHYKNKKKKQKYLTCL